jgi:hypothetical protein
VVFVAFTTTPKTGLDFLLACKIKHGKRGTHTMRKGSVNYFYIHASVICLGPRVFTVFQVEKYMISTHTNIFCGKNGPNSPDFGIFLKKSEFYNRFQ